MLEYPILCDCSLLFRIRFWGLRSKFASIIMAPDVFSAFDSLLSCVFPCSFSCLTLDSLLVFAYAIVLSRLLCSGS